MEDCIHDLPNWMSSNGLWFNNNKTEFLIIDTSKQLTKVNIDCIQVGDWRISSTSSARYLGAWFDNHLSMSAHVTKICSCAFYFIHNTRRIRKYLPTQCTETLIHAFISSCIDY